MELEKWRSQIMRGTLEYCILLMLKEDTAYGYDILQRLAKYPLLSSSESTVYPLLRRLMKEGYLTSKWQESMEGLPARKYYTITDEGREYIDHLNSDWDELDGVIKDLRGE